MNAILSFIPRLFSLRAVVLVLAVVFALVGDQFTLVGWADRALFSILGVPEGANATILSQEAFGPAVAERGLSEPLWSDMAVTAGLAITALYLMLAIPAMGAAVSLPVTLLLGGSLVVMQAALMFYRNAWVPFGVVLTLLAVGYVVMLFWLQPQKHIRALTDNVRDARLKLAKVFLQQGHTNEALEALSLCPKCDAEL